MKIDCTEFGSITINGTSHDILISMSGEVSKRKKKLSKKYYGNVTLSPEAIGTYNRTRDKTIGLFHVTC